MLFCSFVIPVDYFQARYPGTTVIFDMSVVYITMAFFAVCANNILVETISLNTRIVFGNKNKQFCCFLIKEDFLILQSKFTYNFFLFQGTLFQLSL